MRKHLLVGVFTLTFISILTTMANAGTCGRNSTAYESSCLSLLRESAYDSAMTACQLAIQELTEQIDTQCWSQYRQEVISEGKTPLSASDYRTFAHAQRATMFEVTGMLGAAFHQVDISQSDLRIGYARLAASDILSAGSAQNPRIQAVVQGAMSGMSGILKTPFENVRAEAFPASEVSARSALINVDECLYFASRVNNFPEHSQSCEFAAKYAESPKAFEHLMGKSFGNFTSLGAETTRALVLCAGGLIELQREPASSEARRNLKSGYELARSIAKKYPHLSESAQLLLTAYSLKAKSLL